MRWQFRWDSRFFFFFDFIEVFYRRQWGRVVKEKFRWGEVCFQVQVRREVYGIQFRVCIKRDLFLEEGKWMQIGVRIVIQIILRGFLGWDRYFGEGQVLYVKFLVIMVFCCLSFLIGWFLLSFVMQDVGVEGRWYQVRIFYIIVVLVLGLIQCGFKIRQGWV